MTKIKPVLSLIILSICLVCCEKENPDEDPERILPDDNQEKYEVAKGETIEALCDSLYLYAKALYLWNTGLPDIATFNPRKFADKGKSQNLSHIQILRNELEAIKALSSIKPDRFSYIAEYDYVPERPNTGLEVIYDNDGLCRVFSVEEGSAAYNADINRGDIILTVDNRIAKLSNFSLNELQEQLKYKTSKVVFLNGSLKENHTKTISPSVFASKTFSAVQIFIKNDINVGYCMMKDFLGKNIKEELIKMMTWFDEYAVTRLIIDLRYNAGGSNENAYELLRALLPAKENDVINYEQHNKLIDDLIIKSFDFQKIREKVRKSDLAVLENYIMKNGSSNRDLVYILHTENNYSSLPVLKKGEYSKFSPLKKIYFITSEETSSCSELVINTMKSYNDIDVKLIGKNTFGKNVGFFPIDLGQTKKYQVGLASFYNLNRFKQRIPAGGFGVNANVDDDLKHRLNDSEACIKKALELIIK